MREGAKDNMCMKTSTACRFHSKSHTIPTWKYIVASVLLQDPKPGSATNGTVGEPSPEELQGFKKVAHINSTGAI